MGGTNHRTVCTYTIYELNIMGEPAMPVETVHTFGEFQNFWKRTDLNAVAVEKEGNVHEVNALKKTPCLVVPKKTKMISIRTSTGPANPGSCSTVVDKNLQNANGITPLNIQEFFGVRNKKR